MSIATRYRRVADEVSQIAAEQGRDPSGVRLIAVSKTVGVQGAEEALSAGSLDFGENRPDSLVLKAQALPQARWHFIGNIQSRRIPDIVAHSCLVHSLFKLDHAKKISDAALAIGKVQDVLVEVNVSGEETKSGIAPSEAAAFVASCCEWEGLRVRGLMTMAPRADAEATRACFRGLAALADGIRDTLSPDQAAVFDELSMGMSEDWQEAVAAGATMVRIGRAIFDDSFE